MRDTPICKRTLELPLSAHLALWVEQVLSLIDLKIIRGDDREGGKGD